MSDDHRTTPGAGGAGHISGVGFAPFNDAPKPAMTIPEQAVEAAAQRLTAAALKNERDVIANKAREWAANYSAGSDGRNTFVLLAEWIEAREAAVPPFVGVERAAPPLRAREEIARTRAKFDWPVAPKDEQDAWVERHWRDHLELADAVLALSRTAGQEWRDISPKDGWQREVLDWAVDKFGPIALDRRERAMRFVEEAIELAQAEAVMGIEVRAIVDRVFSRAQGYTLKEIAQAGLTLEALAENIGTKVAPLIQQEIERIKSIPKEEWQRRHAAKVAVGAALPAPPVAEPKETP